MDGDFPIQDCSNSSGLCFATNFSKDDRALLANLRSKYSTQGGQTSASTAAALDQAIRDGVRQLEAANGVSPEDAEKIARETKKLSELQVNICSLCQGSGMRKEMYGYRILEKVCGACHGRGTFVKKNGKELKEPITSPKPSFKKPAFAQSSSERVQSLQADIDKISRQIAKYEGEIQALGTQLPAGSAASSVAEKERTDAVLDLIHQLTRITDRLKTDRIAREARLNRYLNPEKQQEPEEGTAQATQAEGEAPAAAEEDDAPPPLEPQASTQSIASIKQGGVEDLD